MNTMRNNPDAHPTRAQLVQWAEFDDKMSEKRIDREVNTVLMVIGVLIMAICALAVAVGGQ